MMSPFVDVGLAVLQVNVFSLEEGQGIVCESSIIWEGRVGDEYWTWRGVWEGGMLGEDFWDLQQMILIFDKN